jgi:tetratricopeptide (TPR) repeat protein
MKSMQGKPGWAATFVIGATLTGVVSLAALSPAFAQGERTKKDAPADDSKGKSKNTVSKNLAKPLKEAHDLENSKKFPEALVKLKEAEGMSGRSPYDDHLINELSGFAYVRTNNFAEAVKYYEPTVNDGFLDQADVPGRVRLLAQLNYQLKNYDKAIDFAQRAVKGGFADETINTILSQSYYLKNDFKGTIKVVDAQVNDEIKAGKTPKQESLELVLSSCVKLDDNECISRALERMVTYYPKPEYWQNLINTLYTSSASNDRTMLNAYRLANEVDVIKRPDDYTEMAQLAIEQGNPGEAQRVLEKAFQKNVFTDPRSQDKNKRLLASAQKAAEQDQPTLAKSAVDADAAATGEKDVGVGLAYLGYQQYDKAADLLSKGIAKGGVKNEAEARLLLGIAQLKSGHKDEAVKSFHTVKGDPNLERLANLWTLHAKQA